MTTISLMNRKFKLDENDARDLFNRYDKDQTGALETEEFEKLMFDALKSLGEENPEETFKSIAQEGMRHYDVNKSGKIEFNEFYKLLDFLILEKGYEMHY